MLPGLVSHPRSLVIPVKVSHYSTTESEFWSLQLQVSSLDDFASLLIDQDTSSDADEWRYRDDSSDSPTGILQSYPQAGVQTYRSTAVGDGLHVITAYYIVPAAERKLLYRGRDYFVRARQSVDGVAWGDWLETVLRIS